MGHSVVVQVGTGCKTFATSLTLVGFLPCVNSTVGVQGRAGGKTLLAEVTNIWPEEE